MAAEGMSKNVKLQIVLIIMIVVIMWVLFGFISWSPSRGAIKTKTDNLNKLKNDLTMKLALNANLGRLKAEIAQLEIKFKESLKLLPEDKEIPRLISQINENMTKSGLDFMLFRPASSRPKDFYTEYPIDIRVQGGYHNVGIFLDHIGRMERIVNVGDVRLTSLVGQAGRAGAIKPKPGTTLTAEFRITTYTYSPEREKAAKEKAAKAPPAQKK